MRLKRILKAQVCRFVVVLWLVLSGFTTVLKAEPVDVEKAKAVALTQLKKTTGDVGLRSAESLNLAYEPKSETNQPYFYVFNGNKGFVIVSGDDRTTPVLAYSDDGYFDSNDIPPNMAAFLKSYEQEIDYITKNKIQVNDISLKREWLDLKNGNSSSLEPTSKKIAESLLNVISTRSYTAGDFLVKTNWDQGDPYNIYCPYDVTVQKRTWTGCVATAMAQIVRYWGVDRGVIPITQGSNSYICGNNYPVSANFESTQYDYTKMPGDISTASAVEKDMIALLSYHCGVAANMNYGVTASGATTSDGARGLTNHFGFNTNYITYGLFSSTYPDADSAFESWKRMIKAEIDELRPVIYTASEGMFGSAHLWICDGYNEGDYFHMNWGYGGRADRVWCKLTSMYSSVGGTSFEYKYDHEVVINIYPTNIPTKIVYVAPNGTGDGSSWTKATSDLYGEMKKDRVAPTQVWVKKGMYYGDTLGTSAFTLGKGTEVYGSFVGSEQRLEERVVNIYNASVLDGQNIRKVISYEDYRGDKHILLDGFLIQNGVDPNGNGGGISFKTHGTIRNCTFKNCTAIRGGGLYKCGSGDIINCTFENNQARFGGGVYCANRSGETVFLRDCYLGSNKADSCGGAVSIDGGVTLSIDNSYIEKNTALFFGGGVYSTGRVMNTFVNTTVNMNSGSVSDNNANNGGGLYFDNGRAFINGGTISGNTAVSGGGIMNQAAALTLNGGLIVNNSAQGSGGGIYCYGGMQTSKNSTVKIQSNSAASTGGGIYCMFGGLFLEGGTIGHYTERAPESREDALTSGGNYASDGAGIYIHSTSNGLIISEPENVIIGGNYANNSGGGVYLAATSISGTSIKKEITICGNAANLGGGLFVATRNVSLAGCTIKHNKARSLGGGVYNNTSYYYALNVYDAVVSDNTAMKGGGFYNIGGINMGSGLISANTANEGGGVYIVGSPYYTHSLSGGSLVGNKASVNGSGVYYNGGGNYNLSGEINISDTIYMYNMPGGGIMGGSPNVHLNVSGLTHHTDINNPIMVRLLYSNTSTVLARYNTSAEATAAVNDNVFKILNYGWRPVAIGTDVRLEAYTPSVAHDYVVYVTPQGSGKKDGSSWENATPDLYGEMMKDRTDKKQIWVKGGVYYGDTTVGQGGDLAAFILGKRNKVYGGFAGNESSLSARAKNNPSILDGQSARRVLAQLIHFTSPADSSFVDGFTIRNGVDLTPGTANIVMIAGGQSTHNGGADMTGNGGGVYLKQYGILANCVIENCKAISGGGVFNYLGKVVDCSFYNNEAEHAGGLFNRGTAIFVKSTISNNKINYWLGYGAGIYNMRNIYIYDGTLMSNNEGVVGGAVYTHAEGTTAMYGGRISDNFGQYYGGGMYSDGTVVIYGGDIIRNQSGQGGGITAHGKLTLYGGNISNNTAGNCGGGISSGGTLVISGESVKISGNTAGGYGGGIASFNGTVTINAGTIGIYTHTAPSSPQEAIAAGGNVALGHDGGGGIYANAISFGSGKIVVGGNYAERCGGGLYTNITASEGYYALYSNVDICGNTSNEYGGGIYMRAGNLTLRGGRISYNKSTSAGGGIHFVGRILSVYDGTVISYNKTDGNGAGIWNRYYMGIDGGQIFGNEATNDGGAIYNYTSSTERATITGGEIFGNQAGGLGNGIYNYGRNLSIYGSIKISDVIYVNSSSYAIALRDLTYHTDHTKPITVSGGTGYAVFTSSLAQSYIDQGIVISTPGLRPIASGSNIYLQSDGTRSMELNPITDNDNIGVEKFVVYPTLITTGGTLTVTSQNEGSVFLWSLSGSFVGQYKLEKGQTQIPAPNTKGNYIVRLTTEDGKNKSVKIVVK
ncbi:MAG: C10 family peptidase [Tannerella sp.]|jgi:hypothetical protein|nr:C10 family peptidase [Tannerella sp.]